MNELLKLKNLKLKKKEVIKMKKFLVICAAVGMMVAVSSLALASTIRINVQPTDVPDETEPRVNYGDAPTGYGPDSWQGPATGEKNKTNWHARYLADGDALSILFPSDAATLTINELAEISYFTKRPTGTTAGQDWWIQIYTRLQASDDSSWWYHDRYINNYNDHTATDAWTKYSTDSEAMTFNSNGHYASSTELTLSDLIASNGSDLIEMISIQTASNWNGFDGYIDGLSIKLTNDDVGNVNFEAVPEPATMMLLGSLATGLFGFAGLKKRKR